METYSREVLGHRFGQLQPCGSSIVAIAVADSESRLVAIDGIPRGQRLFGIEGELSPRPTRYSLQIEIDGHLEPARSGGVERYFWQYMNHSCQPNVWIRGLEVHALRDIQPGEDVTFDYNTTEYEMDAPFRCQCGDSSCLGMIRGFRYLNHLERQRLLPYLPPHLLRHLDPVISRATVVDPQ